MEKTIIYYQTAADIPPPHCFSVKAELQLNSDNWLHIDIEQIFTDREEIPKEEIEAEGFTLNDDFIWKGNLPKIWLKEFEHHASRVVFHDFADSRIHLAKNEGSPKCPLQMTDWIRFTEELVQACLEEAEKEDSMELVLGRLEKNNFYESARVTWIFPQRMALAETLEGDSADFKGEEWTDSQIEIQNWVEVEAAGQDLYQLPKNKGWFWLLNGEIWLPFRKTRQGIIWDWILKRVEIK